MTKSGEWVNTFAEAEKHRGEGEGEAEETVEGRDDEDDEENQDGQREKKRDRRIDLLTSMFPPNKAEGQGQHLGRCLRIWPHLQDSGGFFVAVLKRVKNTTKNVRVAEQSKTSEDKAKAVNDQSQQSHKAKRFPDHLVAV